jgi:hypothetical protein
VSAETGTRRDGDGGIARTYGFTLGHHTLREPWDDVRALAWPELVRLLTTEAV